MPTKHRTRAVTIGADIPRTVKVVPAQFISMVKKLGFIDVRDSKRLTMSAEERLLLLLYPNIIKLAQNYSGLRVDEVQIESKVRLFFRGEENPVYAVRIKDATEFAIPYSYWKKLKLTPIDINRL